MLIPGGVNSPVRSCQGLLERPMMVQSACQDQLVDCEGRHLVDYCMSWGALIHGHAHPRIVDAVQKQIVKGTTYGVTTELEYQLAQEVVECVDSIEKVRFVSTGTEATMTAVRLARGFTEKRRVLKFEGNYHGHADTLLDGVGVPNTPLTTLPYNDVESAAAFFEQVEDLAAVILEPIAGNMGVVPASVEFLQLLRRECDRLGALLIFDEVISGFRVALGGAQELYKITPDLTCLGKIVGGGFPAAAVGGRGEIMDYLAPVGPVYQAGTLSGNPVAMTAGLETIRMIREDPNFYSSLEDKAKIIPHTSRVGSLFSLSVPDFKALFCFMLERGIYIPPSPMEAWFISTVHSQSHLEKTRDLLLEFL